MPTLNELLAPQILFKSITSRVKKVGDTLQRFLGVEIGSSNVEDIPGNTGSYDIFDSVRTVASIRALNAGPARIAANPVSQQPVVCAKFYESMPLYYNRIFPLRKMGGPAVEVDQGGADYIRHQEEILRTKLANGREFLAAGLMRGSAQLLASGDNWLPVFTGGTFTMDFQVPSSNKTTLNMTGGGAIITTLWSDTINADIFGNVMAIDAAFWQQHGYPLRHVWLNGNVWSSVTNNAGLKARCGTGNMVIAEQPAWQGLGRVNNTDMTDDAQTAQIKCLPGITWHIYNGGLTLNGTFTKFFPDTGAGSAVFCPEPSDMWVTSVRGSEWIQENTYQPAVERRGPYFYPTYQMEPARVELTAFELFMPALRVPKCLAVASLT